MPVHFPVMSKGSTSPISPESPEFPDEPVSVDPVLVPRAGVEEEPLSAVAMPSATTAVSARATPPTMIGVLFVALDPVGWPDFQSGWGGGSSNDGIRLLPVNVAPQRLVQHGRPAESASPAYETPRVRPTVAQVDGINSDETARARDVFEAGFTVPGRPWVSSPPSAQIGRLHRGGHPLVHLEAEGELPSRFLASRLVACEWPYAGSWG